MCFVVTGVYFFLLIFGGRLEESGYGVGQRVLELVAVREKYNRRETRVVQILQYISNNIWKYLFGKHADSLERSMENEDACEFLQCWVRRYELDGGSCEGL